MHLGQPAFIKDTTHTLFLGIVEALRAEGGVTFSL